MRRPIVEITHMRVCRSSRYFSDCVVAGSLARPMARNAHAKGECPHPPILVGQIIRRASSKSGARQGREFLCSYRPARRALDTE